MKSSYASELRGVGMQKAKGKMQNAKGRMQKAKRKRLATKLAGQQPPLRADDNRRKDFCDLICFITERLDFTGGTKPKLRIDAKPVLRLARLPQRDFNIPDELAPGRSSLRLFEVRPDGRSGAQELVNETANARPRCNRERKPRDA